MKIWHEPGIVSTYESTKPAYRGKRGLPLERFVIIALDRA